MALVAEHGIATQDAVLECVEADDFIGLRVQVGHFVDFVGFVSGDRVHRYCLFGFDERCAVNPLQRWSCTT